MTQTEIESAFHHLITEVKTSKCFCYISKDGCATHSLQLSSGFSRGEGLSQSDYEALALFAGADQETAEDLAFDAYELGIGG